MFALFKSRRRMSLTEAVSKDSINAVKKLIRADPRKIDECDEKGRIALGLASERGNTRLVRRLLSRGADINQKDQSRRSPTYWALINGHLDVLKLLLENGPDLYLGYEEKDLGESVLPLLQQLVEHSDPIVRANGIYLAYEIEQYRLLDERGGIFLRDKDWRVVTAIHKANILRLLRQHRTARPMKVLLSPHDNSWIEVSLRSDQLHSMICHRYRGTEVNCADKIPSTYWENVFSKVDIGWNPRLIARGSDYAVQSIYCSMCNRTYEKPIYETFGGQAYERHGVLGAEGGSQYRVRVKCGGGHALWEYEEGTRFSRC
jgi:hypothetical protein